MANINNIELPIDEIQKILDNSYFIENSFIRNRMNTQLFYVYFNFTGTAFDTILGENKNDIVKKLSINAVDVDFPKVSVTVNQQKLFNKNFNTNISTTMGDLIGVTFVESSDMYITNFFLNIAQLNMGAHRKTVKYYPEEIFFDIYFIPIIVNKNITSEDKKFKYKIDFTNKSFSLYKNCCVKDTDDMDFNQLDDPKEPLTKIYFAVEERYIVSQDWNAGGYKMEISEEAGQKPTNAELA